MSQIQGRADNIMLNPRPRWQQNTDISETE